MSYKHIIATRKGGPEVLETRTAGLQEPGPGQALVRIQRAGVAFGDLLWISGRVPGGPRHPFIPGYDFVGVIERLGAGQTDLEPGQAVAGLVKTGGYSEYASVPFEYLAPVPEGVVASEAVCATLNYLTAVQIFQRTAGLKPGQRVLVHGASGGVGTAMLQVGRLLDLEMYGTASQAKQDLVASLGATPIDYKNEDFVERIASLTGDGVDLVVDHVGGNHLKRSFQTLRPGGLLVSSSAYGSVRGDAGFLENILGFIRLPLWSLWPNGKKAILLDVVPYYHKNPAELAEDFPIVLSYLAEGRIQPVIDRQLPLVEARTALELLLHGKASGKIVLVCNDG